MNYCFSAGPSALPTMVLEEAKLALGSDFSATGSILELNHRGPLFRTIIDEIEGDLRRLLAIPSHYRVLFCQGGGRGQFAAVPLNLHGLGTQADYMVSGHWSAAAAQEASKYLTVNRIDILCTDGVGRSETLPMDQWPLTQKAAWVHYCPNETIQGIAITGMPSWADTPILVGDFSSTLLSKPILIEKFGIVYAAAQKNLGPAGVTVVIVREDLLEYAAAYIPSIFSYKLMAEHHSLYQTPPTLAWYLVGKMLKWIEMEGGIGALEQSNRQKAQLLYRYIDNSTLYYNRVSPNARSDMNIVFQLTETKLHSRFLAEAEDARLYGLKGHASVGGMRASLYNAIPLEAVHTLIEFMEGFKQRYGY